MTKKELVQLIVSCAATMILSFIGWQSTHWSSSIDELTKSVVNLNTKMEVLVTQESNTNSVFTDKLADHEARIRDLEKYRRSER